MRLVEQSGARFRSSHQNPAPRRIFYVVGTNSSHVTLRAVRQGRRQGLDARVVPRPKIGPEDMRPTVCLETIDGENLGLWNFPRHAYIGRKLLARKFRIR